MRRSFDVLLLFLLLTARLRLNSFAESGLFEHVQNVARHPLLGRLLPPDAVDAFGPWLGDPIFLLLTAASLLALLVYAIVDLLHDRIGERGSYRIKLGLVWLILAATVFLPALKLALLRHDNLPQSYSHDGGVIQTEITIDYFLAGRNPYSEGYENTPMAEWGFPEFRTALDHYPYLPATFVLSAPGKLLADTLLGWYDQRFVYLLLFLLTLLLIPSLTRHRPADALGLTMLLGLNPIMGLDILFGQNDSFVLAWVVLSLWLLQRRRLTWSAIAFGVACASKPTAWFLAPFWGLAVLMIPQITWQQLRTQIPTLLKRLAPALVAFLALVLPYLVWDANALIDDVWRWAAGTATLFITKSGDGDSPTSSWPPAPWPIVSPTGLSGYPN